MFYLTTSCPTGGGLKTICSNVLMKAALKTYYLSLTRPLLSRFLCGLLFIKSLFLKTFEKSFFLSCRLPDLPRVLFAGCQKREIKDMEEKPPEKSDWLPHSIFEPTSDRVQCSQQNFRLRPNKKSKKRTRGDLRKCGWRR